MRLGEFLGTKNENTEEGNCTYVSGDKIIAAVAGLVKIDVDDSTVIKIRIFCNDNFR